MTGILASILVLAAIAAVLIVVILRRPCEPEPEPWPRSPPRDEWGWTVYYCSACRFPQWTRDGIAFHREMEHAPEEAREGVRRGRA